MIFAKWKQELNRISKEQISIIPTRIYRTFPDLTQYKCTKRHIPTQLLVRRRLKSRKMGVNENSEEVTVTDVAKLAEHISALYLNKKFSDVTLVLDGQRLHAHKVILAARSEYFEALLFDGLQESTLTEITLNDVSSKAFHMLLKYMYTGSITIVPSNMDLTLEVMGLAHQYSFRHLQSAIIAKLKTMLNLKNICSILNVANLYDLRDLREICHLFLDQHASEILSNDCFNDFSQESLVNLLKRDSFFAPEIEIFKSVAKWYKVNNDVDELVIKCIRLPWLSVVEIVSTVWPSKLVDNEILLNAIAEIVEVKPRKSNCRALFLLDENVATPQHKAEVISGKRIEFLLTGNRDVGNWSHHSIGDSNGFTFKLGSPTFINYIHMMLFDSDTRDYSYYVEVSLDQRKWKKVIDYTNCSCRSYQSLYFQHEIVQYIRVVGTRNSKNTDFHLIFFEAENKSDIPKSINGIICPTSNVATPDKKAIVISGQSPTALLDGDFKNYTGSTGYTYYTIGAGSITIQLAQPYVISSMKLLLWDQDDRFYNYYIESSLNNTDWEMVVDCRNENCKSWQTHKFKERAMVYIKIVGTHNSSNNGFHVVHFECPASEEK